MREKIINGEINIDNIKNDKSFQKSIFEVLSKDMVYYKNENGNHFIDRKKLIKKYHLIDNINFFSHKGLFYKCEGKDKVSKKRMLVIFSSFSSIASFDESSVYKRHFFQNLINIGSNVPDDTLIVRIPDFNLHIGSFYRNTKNYPTFEEEIREIITLECSKNFIPKENVVLYGTGKGGTASLFLGVKYNYNFVTCDPILSIDNSYLEVNKHYLFDKIDFDLWPSSLDLQSYKGNGITIISELSIENYENYKTHVKYHKNISVYNFVENNVSNYNIAAKCSSLVNGAINNLLYNSSLDKK